MRVRSMIAMFSWHQMMSLMPLLVAMLSSCASEKAEIEVPVPPVVIEEPTEPKPVSLLLACAPSDANRAMTRLDDEVVQMNDATSYRSIPAFRIIAQTKGVGGVTITDSSVDNPAELVDEPSTHFRYYHSTYCSMVEGVNACLVYAKAENATPPDGVSVKVWNGSLKPEIEDIPTWPSSTSQLRFSLEPILDATVAREEGEDLKDWEIAAWALADAMTRIVDESYDEDYAWKSSTNIILKNLYQRFTNNGADLPGSAASVKQWMLSLAAAADYYYKSSLVAVGEAERKILGIIKTKATAAAAAVTGDYPRGVNLPDGAAVLRWTEVEKTVGESVVKVKKFVPQMQTTTLDDINSVSRFVYPPALYYFVDSEIKTSPAEKDFYEDRVTTPSLTWDDFLNGFTETKVVITPTPSQTVAVKDPMQYAVARLSLNVKASADELPYDEEKPDDKIPASDLTLTGVIIGGQRPVGYDFKPTDKSDVDVKFVYDSQVNQTQEALTTTGATSNTLVLESYGGKVDGDGEDVNVILEFQYADGEGKKEFKCLNGTVYPGTRFYLVGEVKLSEGTPKTDVPEAEKPDVQKRVFTQDRTTEIQMTVTSLEKAYNVLPSILSNNLEIGVMTTPQWIAAEPPETVVMD